MMCGKHVQNKQVLCWHITVYSHCSIVGNSYRKSHTIDRENFVVKIFFGDDLFQQKLNAQNILHNVHWPIPILVAKVWQRNLDYTKNLQAKYFTGKNIPVYCIRLLTNCVKNCWYYFCRESIMATRSYHIHLLNVAFPAKSIKSLHVFVTLRCVSFAFEMICMAAGIGIDTHIHIRWAQ